MYKAFFIPLMESEVTAKLMLSPPPLSGNPAPPICLGFILTLLSASSFFHCIYLLISLLSLFLNTGLL